MHAPALASDRPDVLPLTGPIPVAARSVEAPRTVVEFISSHPIPSGAVAVEVARSERRGAAASPGIGNGGRAAQSARARGKARAKAKARSTRAKSTRAKSTRAKSARAKSTRLNAMTVNFKRIKGTPRGNARRVVASPGERAAAVRFALTQVGQPYRRGGSGNGGWDCSGLVSAAYRQVGVQLPHSSGGIGQRGTAIAHGQWEPGDVIVTPGHVALYLGGGLLVEAANPRKGVRVAPVR